MLLRSGTMEKWPWNNPDSLLGDATGMAKNDLTRSWRLQRGKMPQTWKRAPCRTELLGNQGKALACSSSEPVALVNIHGRRCEASEANNKNNGTCKSVRTKLKPTFFKRHRNKTRRKLKLKAPLRTISGPNSSPASSASFSVPWKRFATPPFQKLRRFRPVSEALGGTLGKPVRALGTS